MRPLDDAERDRILLAIQPAIKQCEALRLKTWLCLFILVTPLWFVSMPYFLSNDIVSFADTFGGLFLQEELEIDIPYLLSGSIWFCVILAFLYTLFDRNYKLRTKRIILRDIAAQMDAQYFPKGFKYAGRLHSHCLLPRFSKEDLDDGFRFNAHGHELDVQETRLFYRSLLSLLIIPRMFQKERCLLLSIKTNKTHTRHTLVLSRHHYRRLKGYKAYRDLKEMDKTAADNSGIFRQYVILSPHTPTTQDLLSPEFTQSFTDLKKTISARSINISFKKNEIAVYAEKSHNLYEPAKLRKKLKAQSFTSTFDEIEAIHDFIEALKASAFAGL